MTHIENIESVVHEDSFGEGGENDDPDEIGYYFDDEKQDFELEERGASYFKIYAVTTADSLPIYRSDGKKQKYAKRQIISTIDSTTFFIKGVGFKVRNDSSYIKAYIKNVQQGGNLKIESWTDTAITVKYPPLTDSLFIKKTFSIKFKVFRANDKAGKPNVSRVKSKSCISDFQAKPLIGYVCNSLTNQINVARQTYNLPEKPSAKFYKMDGNYHPMAGDLLSTFDDRMEETTALVLTTPSDKTGTFTGRFIKENKPCDTWTAEGLTYKMKIGLIEPVYYVKFYNVYFAYYYR